MNRSIGKISAPALGYTIGICLLLPTDLLTLLLLVIPLAFALEFGEIRIDRKAMYVLVGMAVAALGCIPGILVGNNEAILYVLRIMACAAVAISLLSFSRRGDIYLLESFLRGMFVAALINAIITIVTALNPEVYHQLYLSDITGFDKSMRRFRSPGLTRGFDTSGYLSIFAICALPVLPVGRRSPYLTLLLLFVFSTAVILSSRSSMFLLSVALTLIVLFQWRSTGMVYKAFAVVIVGFALFVGLTLGAGILGISVPAGWEEMIGKYIERDIMYIYSENRAGYVMHFEASDIAALPDHAEWLPDNFYFRSLASVGGVGMVLMLLPVVYMMLSSVYRHGKEYRALAIILSVLFPLMSIKNNYIYFVPFFSIMFVLYATRPAKRT